MTDALRLNGLGFVLLQIGPAGEFTLVQCGSCSLTDAQTRYSTVELECLGVVWASQKCDFYLRGLPSFEVWTDHRQLEGVWKKEMRDVTNPRLAKCREKMMPYAMSLKWVPG